MNTPSIALFLLLSAPGLSAQNNPEPIRPASVFEPPAASKVRSLKESTAASPPELLTTEEKTEYRETGDYAEAVALARELEKRSRFAKLLPIGKSAEGRDLYVLIASKDRAFTPEQARKTGKPVVFVQNGIHAGEIAGKSAMLMLLRDLLTSGRHAALLDRVIVANLLVFNADGHEKRSRYHRMNQNGPEAMGFRGTAQRLNLNRDYMKADAPEMQAWLRFYNAWRPHLLIDHHVTDGMDFQYDITVDMPMNGDVAMPLARWTSAAFLPALFEQMQREGHVIGPYGYFDSLQPERGFRIEIFSPRYSQGYAAVRNRAGLLVETHSLKAFRTRVWAHYDVTLKALETLAADPGAIVAAASQADKATIGLGGSSATLYLEGKLSAESEPHVFRGLTPEKLPAPLAGGEYTAYRLPAVDVNTKIFRTVEVRKGATLPEAYVVPAAWTEVIARLRLHGVESETLRASRRFQCGQYTLHDPRLSTQPFEGRIRVDVRTSEERSLCEVPAGSVLVKLNQPAARVAANLLEPDAPDSLLRWGFFHSLFERKEYFSAYVMEPFAQRMLEANPGLRTEFEKKLKEDAAFAASQRARLEWFYQRSPYAEPGYRQYPVLRVWSEGYR
ncbi:MAG: M14 family metallopeptidase [Bryobacterales bacterium]|nr:M14 family metallopeptidase [Bryobacterales bacterium]